MRTSLLVAGVVAGLVHAVSPAGATLMKDPTYWKTHYVLESDADEIEKNIKSADFASGGERLELIHFVSGPKSPNILVSMGSGCHAFCFAELGYRLFLRGYNVFIMPRHGGLTIRELETRHVDALKYISGSFGDRTGVFSEGLGGFIMFYVSLAGGPLKSAVYQNSPGVLTEEEFRSAVLRGKRRWILPVLRFFHALFPHMEIPISLYLDWEELVDSEDPNRGREARLVSDGYLKDLDFDRKYTLSAVLSLLDTPPPRPLSELGIPTMVMVAKRGFGGKDFVKYLEGLFHRLPAMKKKMVEVDGSVYWMLSHPTEAAEVISEWFRETL